ncbi:cullin-2-like [Cloeon dipterum]|uniref:cullin-2-like n=1 Tax=Cloeon dipterum TaxID=197152 RepID=UPI00322083C6
MDWLEYCDDSPMDLSINSKSLLDLDERPSTSYFASNPLSRLDLLNKRQRVPAKAFCIDDHNDGLGHTAHVGLLAISDIRSWHAAARGISAWYKEMLKTGFKEKLMKSLAFQDLMLIEFFQPVYQIYIEALNYHSKMVELDDELRIVENLVKHFKLDKVWIKAVFTEEYGNCVVGVILENVFEPFTRTILGNLDRLCEEDRYEALSSLYLIFKDVSDGSVMTRLTSKFDAIVKREAKGIASETDQQVKDLAKLYSKRFKMINTIFRGDSKFLDQLKRTVAPILNQKTGPNSPCKSPEMLAKLLDSLMRNKDLPESEIMEELDRIGLIYQILLEKDVFKSFYLLLTAKRLHQKGFRSLKLEEGLLQRLPEWGIRDETLKSIIVTMIEDVLTSNNVLEYFNKFKGDFGFVFTTQVMKIQTWPICSSDNAQIVLSSELKAILEIYENNHRLFFNNRKLVWNYLHSTSEIQINYSNKPYLLSLNTYQMAIMLLFEKNNHLGFMNIKETLAIPEETLVDQLACLVESKLLIAHPMVKILPTI